MPTKVTAKDGDCLCVIAMQNGFLNCQPLRDEPKNAAFLKRPLRAGDVVTVPDIRPNPTARPTDAAHTFVLKNSPPVSIRYVHGAPSFAAFKDDPETTVLNVSNYPTDTAGPRAEVPFPNDFGFHQEAHVDPDTFLVEVVDPLGGGGPINVTLEPLTPVYSLVDGKLSVTSHVNPPARPQTFIQCAAIPGTVAYRSKYLRLVTHPEDNSAAPEQTVLIVTPADGRGTGKAADPDNVEILDFELRAIYTIPRCPAPKKCAVSVSRPLGDESEQRRFRIAFHIFKRRTTGLPLRNLTVEKVRHLALRDLRGFYAQASMAPKLVSADGSKNGSAVVFMAEPDNNMMVVGESSGKGASGHDKHKQPSTLTMFDDMHVIGTITMSAKMTPHEVAKAIENGLDPLTFKVDIFKNPKPSSGKHKSCDIIVTRIDGSTVDLSVQTDDTILQNTITVARVDLDAFNAEDQSQQRRVFRSSPGPEGAMNVYGVGFISPMSDGSRPAAFSMPVSFRSQMDETQARQIADSIFCSSAWLDDSAVLIDVLPHECGHILGKVHHVDEKDPHYATEMMNKSAKEPSQDEPNPTRISDYPILVNYELDEDKTRLINAVNRMTTSRSDLLENW